LKLNFFEGTGTLSRKSLLFYQITQSLCFGQTPLFHKFPTVEIIMTGEDILGPRKMNLRRS